MDDVFQAVLPAGHRLARRRRTLELSELSGEPLGRRGTDQRLVSGSPSTRAERAGFSPRADFASDDYIAVQALVAAGLGVSVIPGLAVVHPLPGLAVRKLSSGAPRRYISAARPRDAYHGAAVAAMIDSLRRALTKRSPPLSTNSPRPSEPRLAHD